MTLKDKFNNLNKTKIYYLHNSVECVKIADDYAIEFVRWYFDYVNEKDYYLKVLNEFKKEKEL